MNENKCSVTQKNDQDEDSTRMNDDTFLRCLQSSMLSNLTLPGIEAIAKVYISRSSKIR